MGQDYCSPELGNVHFRPADLGRASSFDWQAEAVELKEGFVGLAWLLNAGLLAAHANYPSFSWRSTP